MTLMTFVGSLIHECGANLGRVAIGGMSILSVRIAVGSVTNFLIIIHLHNFLMSSWCC